MRVQNKNARIDIRNLQMARLKPVDRSVVSGNLFAWLNKRAKPLHEFKDSNELFKADIDLINDYKSERMRLFLFSINSEPLSSKDDFEVFLEKIGLYHSSKAGLSDAALGHEFIKLRFEAYKELSDSLKPQAPLNSDIEPPANSTEAHEELSEVNDMHRNIFESISQENTEMTQSEVPQALEDKPLDVSEPNNLELVHEASNQSFDNVERVLFPPLELLKKAIKDKQEKYNQLIAEHKVAYAELMDVYKLQAAAEKNIRSFDDEKTPYLFSKQKIPDDLKEKLAKAHEVSLDAERLRVQKAQAFFKIQYKLSSLIESKILKKRKITPDEKSRLKQFCSAESSELKKKYKSLDKIHDKFTALSKGLRKEIKDGVLEVSIVEEALNKIDNKDFDGLEKILPKEFEISDGNETYKVKTKKWLSAIKKAQSELNCVKTELLEISPEVQVVAERELYDEMQVKIRKNNNLINESECGKKTITPKFKEALEDDNLDFSRWQSLSGQRYYKLKVENLSFKVEEYEPQRIVLGLLLGEFQKINIQTNPLDNIRQVLNLFYAQVRKCGEEIPNQSISGIFHSPYTAITRATRNTGGVIFARKDNWILRTTLNSVMNLLENPDKSFKFRISCRVIASPEMLEELDKLTKEHDFLYKVPSSVDAWNREDPLTIYLSKELSFEKIVHIASKLEPYVYSGNDLAMLGEEIKAGDGYVFKGIKILETPSLFEVADVVSASYKIDKDLGKAVSEYFNVEEINGRVSYSSSPGKLEAVKMLINSLMTGKFF